MADELIRCPSCNHELRLPRELFGQPVECPQCGNRFSAPAATGAPVVRPAQPNYAGFDGSGPQLPSVRPSVRAPAIALVIMSIIGLGFGGYGLFTASAIQANPKLFEKEMTEQLDQHPDLKPDQRARMLEFFSAESFSGKLRMCCGIDVATNVLALIGGICMLRMRGYSLALLGSIAALNPVNIPACLLQFPFGLWALIVLLNANARRILSMTYFLVEIQFVSA